MLKTCDHGLYGNYSAAEIEFLRHEVVNLEKAISELHTNRAGGIEAIEASESARRLAEEGLERLRSKEADTSEKLVSANAEISVLHLRGQILLAELADAEEARRASNEAESCALSVARSYRAFAAEGAHQLDQLQVEMQATQTRLQHRIEGFHEGARFALRRQSLRAALRWPCLRRLHSAMQQWRLVTLVDGFQRVLAVRLDAAHRCAQIVTHCRSDIHIAQQRIG